MQSGNRSRRNWRDILVRQVKPIIDYVSLGIWIVLAFVHLAIATVGCKDLQQLRFLRTMVSDPPTMGFVFAMGLLVFWVFARANFKSGFFTNRE